MKNILRLVAATAVLSASVSVPLNAFGQTYQLSGQLPNGFYGFSDMGNFMGTVAIPHPTFQETVTIDPNALTIRVAGSVSFAAASGGVSLDETRQLGVFPNPPQMVPGELTVTVSETAEALPFDTGVRQMSWNGQFYTFNGGIQLNKAVTTSYSLVTGGNTYTGSAAANASFSVDLGSEVDASNYPGSINLLTGPDFNSGVGFIQPLPSFTAPNGFQIQVASVPEPSALALGGLAGCALLLRRLRSPK